MIDKQLQAQLRKDLQDFMADRVEDQRQAAMETDPCDWTYVEDPRMEVIIHDLYSPSNHDHTHLS